VEKMMGFENPHVSWSFVVQPIQSSIHGEENNLENIFWSP
jgi:hypothetical protein